jgi:hypothetical protein
VGAGAGGQAAGGACGTDLSDDFSGAQLSPCWSVLNGAPASPLVAISLANGSMHLQAKASANGNQNGVWYQGATKALVYKQVTSRFFKVTTTAHPRKASAPTALPTKDLHVGGVMVRNPAAHGGNSENYLFIMVGHSEGNAGVVHQGVELKSTVNGCSNWSEPDWAADDAQLRICRIGADFRLYKRAPGAATWTPAVPPAPSCAGNVVAGNVLTRADLPETVQVGLALNFSQGSDLDVAFDELTFAPLAATATATDCTAD